MQIQFKDINKSNYIECVELEVYDEQKDFIAPNWYSLLEVSYESEERHPMAIYKDEVMIGFIMYVFYPADDDYPLDSWWIERLMIDQKYQNKGYGKSTLERFINYFRSKYGNVELRIATEPNNLTAIKLYENTGFVKTGEFAADEVVLLKE
ncbi:GNAT family N-acetyltransferase [Aquisalibacillus elongatus]|uniref:Diamine N-acetyltransferase n=1 Tax=Aquisalibacillus elongatus TaxID=485577 RepID=A0A3N5BCT4_9BACI|nr:GNAT family N-acetyltransferase [Aquisalibacillus elongatus]RPF55247.1 diamine N-acetyltransferase [Aquisalibacillus elongatus]